METEHSAGFLYESNSDFVNRLKDAFDTMVVFKNLQQNNFISSFKLPSFMRDYVVKNFQMMMGLLILMEQRTLFVHLFPKRRSGRTSKIASLIMAKLLRF